VGLLPDREMATVEAWLAAHPGITAVSHRFTTRSAIANGVVASICRLTRTS